MAKPFYSMDEVCQMLKKTPDEVKGLVREGTLREFRDAGKVFFKAEDVQTLRKGSSDTSAITLEAVGDEPPVPKDLGASDSIALEPVADEGDKKDDTVITASGISVFDDDELEIDADPMAKTSISRAVGDEVPLEGAGSGSGLLDLTREADDTSLGAELLDEIYPGEDEATERPAAAAAEAAEEEADETLAEPRGEVILPMTSMAAADPNESIFAGLLVGALLLLALSAAVVGGVMQGFLPGYAASLASNFLMFVGGAVLLPLICAGVGWVVGKAGSPRRA
jgi:hypothetical protein